MMWKPTRSILHKKEGDKRQFLVSPSPYYLYYYYHHYQQPRRSSGTSQGESSQSPDMEDQPRLYA